MNLLLLVSAGLAVARPNILLLIADDLGSNDLGIHGAEYDTPNLDRFFIDGLNFTNYYTQSSCSPTRSAIMTGRYPFRLGLQSITTLLPGTPSRIPADEPTWAELLRGQGYKNYYLGKWHLGYASFKYTPIGRGWDSFTGLLQGGGDYYRHNLSFAVPWVNGGKPHNGFDFWTSDDAETGTLRPDFSAIGRHTNDIILERATKLLESAAETESPDEPWSITLAFQEVHAPNQEPTASRDDATSHCDDNSAITLKRRAIYCKQVSVLDDTVGRIIALLQKLGLYDNTLIIFTTDNGGMTLNPAFKPGAGGLPADHGHDLSSIGSNYPRRAGKATQFEGGTHGIAAISGGALPKELAGKSIDALQHATDLGVTIMEAAGATAPAKCDGVNMLAGKSHEKIFIDIGPWNPILKHQAHAIRVGEMKYVSSWHVYDGWYKHGYVMENATAEAGVNGCSGGCLFNLTADPHERKNLRDTAHVEEWLELDAMIYEEMLNDWKPWFPGFFKVNTSTFNLTYDGHDIWWPFMEPFPEGAAKFDRTAASNKEEELVDPAEEIDAKTLQWFFNAL